MENSKWIMNQNDFENLKPIREQSKCLATIFSKNMDKNQKEIIQYGKEANSQIIVQIGGKVDQDFDSRRPFVHLFIDQNTVKISY